MLPGPHWRPRRGRAIAPGFFSQHEAKTQIDQIYGYLSTNGLNPSNLITVPIESIELLRSGSKCTKYQNEGFWCVEWCWMMLNVQTFDNYLYGYTWRLEAHQKTCPVAAVWLPHAACTRSTAPEIKPHLNMNENLRLAVIDPQILTTFPSSPAWANKS